MSDTMSAFVVMPFDTVFNQVYNEIIVPVCEDLGYEVNKADSTDTHQSILKDIVEGIDTADLIIADLTNSNPNVFYEIGIAHGLGIPTFLIAQDLDELPFDLSAYEIKEYSTQFNKIEELENSLRDVAEKHVNGDIQFGSPVSDFANVDIIESNSQIEARRTESAAEEDDEETEPDKGVLEYVVEAENRRQRLERDFSNIEDNTNNVSNQILELTSKIQNARESGRLSPKEANSLARDMAQELNNYADLMENDISSVDENLNFMMDAFMKFIEFSDPTDQDHLENLQEQEQELREFITESEAVIDDIETFKSEIGQLKGLNRELTKASDNLSEILSDLISSLKETSSKAERMLSLIEVELKDN